MTAVVIPTEDLVRVLRRDLVPLIDAQYCLPSLLEDSFHLVKQSLNPKDLEFAVHCFFKTAAVNSEVDRQVYQTAFLKFCMTLETRLQRCGITGPVWDYRFSQLIGDDVVLFRTQ